MITETQVTPSTVRYLSLPQHLYVWRTQLWTPEQAQEYLQRLEQITEYYPPEKTRIQIRGRLIPIPRQQVAYGDPGLAYRFTGISLPARSWEHDETGRILLEIKKLVEATTGYSYNFVLMNRYRDGNSYIGPHSDDERDLMHARIAGVSLGGTRSMHFTSRESEESLEVALPSGSLVVIDQPTNRFWKHSIPKQSRLVSPRISLTFRMMKKKSIRR